MRLIKYAFMVCAAAGFVGCATYDEDTDARGGSGTYSDDPVVEGLGRGVNTNWYGPVNSGPEAARGPGTPSGQFDHNHR